MIKPENNGMAEMSRDLRSLLSGHGFVLGQQNLKIICQYGGVDGRKV